MTGRWVGDRVGLDPVENKNNTVTPIPQESNPYIIQTDWNTLATSSSLFATRNELLNFRVRGTVIVV